MKELIEKIFSSTGNVVGITLSPDLGLEVALVDQKTKVVKKYQNSNISFNNSKKSADDVEEFRNALDRMVLELGIESQSKVILTLPSMFFSFVNAEHLTDANDTMIRSIIEEEVSESYIFRTNPPSISWQVQKPTYNNKRRIVYTAFHQETINELTDAILTCGLIPIAVENDYSTMIKALEFANVIDEDVKAQRNWGILFINENNYSIFSFEASNLAEVFEEPLATKTFDRDEINEAVSSAINYNLSFYKFFESLVIVNNVSAIDLEEVGNALKIDSEKILVSNNRRQERSILRTDSSIKLDSIQKLSLQAIGASVSDAQPYLLNFNYTPELKDVNAGETAINLFGVDVPLNKDNLKKLAVLVLIVCVIIGATVSFVSSMVKAGLSSKVDDVNSEITRLNAEKAKYKLEEAKTDFNLQNEIIKVMESNEYSVNLFNSLSANIPQSVWATYFYTNKKGDSSIVGRTHNIEDIYTFYKGIQSILPKNNLLVSKIKVVDSGNYSKQMYEFNILNQGYANFEKSIRNSIWGNKLKEHENEIKKYEKERAKFYYYPETYSRYKNISLPKVQPELVPGRNGVGNESEVVPYLPPSELPPM